MIQKSLAHSKKLALVIIIFLAATSVGLVAVFYNQAFMFGTNIAKARFFENPKLLFVTVPFFFLLSAFVCRRFAPNAAGGGPEHVVAALRKLGEHDASNKDISEFLSLKIMLVKIISSLLCNMGGGALGREGPIVQISASIFLFIAQRMQRLLPTFDLRTWIVAGSAAGVAAAFNTPIAGIIFALEELSQFHLEKKFFGFKAQTFFAVIVAGITAQIITGSYILFTFPSLNFVWKTDIAIVLLFLASLCGLSAFILKIAINYASKWRDSLTGYRWYLFPLASGLTVAAITYFVGIHSFGPGSYTILATLGTSVPLITVTDSLGRFLNIIVTSASGCAGGLLLPALALGASIGSFSGALLPMTDTKIFVATGMAAFLGALLNAPLTAAVLVLELTNQRELILPLFLATLISSWIFKTCNEAYDQKKGIHVDNSF